MCRRSKYTQQQSSAVSQCPPLSTTRLSLLYNHYPQPKPVAPPTPPMVTTPALPTAASGTPSSGETTTPAVLAAGGEPSAASAVSGAGAAEGAYSVLVRNLVAVEDVEDDDEYEEVVADMEGLLPEAGRVGLEELVVPRTSDADGSAGDGSDMVVVGFHFHTMDAAAASVEVLHGMVVGGKTAHASLVHTSAEGSTCDVAGNFFWEPPPSHPPPPSTSFPSSFPSFLSTPRPIPFRPTPPHPTPPHPTCSS